LSGCRIAAIRHGQIPTAQVILRFRGLDQSLDQNYAALQALDLNTRNEFIAAPGQP
jgi:hypothetical protein